MRMTNKIMQNNSLYNINNNKILQDKLSTQMSTQKKITRPSDDPIIAIRALRLRTSVSELTQYYKKNAPDADSWLTVTEKALDTGTEVLTDLLKQANKGANKDLGVEELTIIVQQMKALRDEFYSTGNVDYAGRYVFTGYRTNSTLSFTSEVDDVDYDYMIKEPVTISKFDTISYTDMRDIEGLAKSNYEDPKYANVIEQGITNDDDIHRIRLSYSDLEEGTVPTITKADGTALATVDSVAASPEQAYQDIKDANGNGDELIIFIPETGEIVFSDAAYSKLDAQVSIDEEFTIEYEKNSWMEGDLRPEHYFECTATITKGDNVENKIYNSEAPVNSQLIEYNVGYNQTIQINTLACDVFTHDLDRDIDDLEYALGKLAEIDAIVDDLSSVKKGLDEGTSEYNLVDQQLTAANKAYDYIRENIHKIFENTITKSQNYLDVTNVAVTDNGTRSSRLELISNRLMDQQTTFQTLQSENEDVDIAEVIVQLTSTELTYEAALMATGKIMQTSLMNYI